MSEAQPVKEIVVALSGTLETFSLPDVLRLLSSTKKTGLLALDGDRGRGRVWVRDGDIVAADADRAVEDAVEGVAFELLRFVDARFDFDSGAEPAVQGEARPVEDVLAEAESRLVEWREIEAVVPSLDVWVRMVTEIEVDRTVDPVQWRVLAQVGTGTGGHDLAGRLGQGEYDVCRQLRDLIEGGLVELDDAPVEEPTYVEPTFVEPVLDDDAVSSLGTDLASFVAAGTVEAPVEVDFSIGAPEEPEPQPEAVEEIDTPAAVEDVDAAEPVADAGETDDTDDDLASQLSQLSPKAAAALEATWGDDEPAAAAEPVDADEPAPTSEPVEASEPASNGDEIDQNLLLRFLSSTKT